MTENDKQLYQLTQGITRIANYMEEILRLVKKDQEESKKRREDADFLDKQSNAEYYDLKWVDNPEHKVLKY